MGYDYVELNSNQVVVRKDHKCCWCGEGIPRRSNALSISSTFDDRIGRDWMHLECDEARGRLDWSDYQDGYEFGIFVRGQTYEYGDEPEGVLT